MENYKKILIIALISVASFSAGKFLSPKNVEVREVERVVFKDRIIQDDRQETHTRTKETVLPDGTRVKETFRDQVKESKRDENREQVTDKEKTSITNNRSSWSVGLYTNKEMVAGTIDRRILGGLFIGIYGRSPIPLQKPEIGLGLRLEF